MVESIRIHKRAYAAQSQHLISQLSIKKRCYKNKLSIAFTKLLHPFDLCCEKFDVHSTSRMKRGGEKKKKRKKKRIVYKESSVELCPLGHRVFACTVTKLEKERERRRH